jgi:hypothetical protein
LQESHDPSWKEYSDTLYARTLIQIHSKLIVIPKYIEQSFQNIDILSYREAISARLSRLFQIFLFHGISYVFILSITILTFLIVLFNLNIFIIVFVVSCFSSTTPAAAAEAKTD